MFKRKSYNVKLCGRAGIEYSEGGRTLKVDSEFLVEGEFDLVIYTSSIRRWDSPDSLEDLSPSEVERIKQNIATALKSSKITWQD